MSTTWSSALRMRRSLGRLRPPTQLESRRALVAFDCRSEAAHRAMHLAARLAGPGGLVVLVYVRSPPEILSARLHGGVSPAERWQHRDALRTAAQLIDAKASRVEVVDAVGDAAAEIL